MRQIFGTCANADTPDTRQRFPRRRRSVRSQAQTAPQRVPLIGSTPPPSFPPPNTTHRAVTTSGATAAAVPRQHPTRARLLEPNAHRDHPPPNPHPERSSDARAPLRSVAAARLPRRRAARAPVERVSTTHVSPVHRTRDDIARTDGLGNSAENRASRRPSSTSRRSDTSIGARLGTLARRHAATMVRDVRDDGVRAEEKHRLRVRAPESTPTIVAVGGDDETRVRGARILTRARGRRGGATLRRRRDAETRVRDSVHRARRRSSTRAPERTRRRERARRTVTVETTPRARGLARAQDVVDEDGGDDSSTSGELLKSAKNLSGDATGGDRERGDEGSRRRYAVIDRSIRCRSARGCAS